jgi:anti-sigma regulatory factor (Ser/Thr protein kinase)
VGPFCNNPNPQLKKSTLGFRQGKIMFTVEQESDYTKIVSIDDGGKFEDIEVYIEEDNTVYIRQFAEEFNEYQLCIISFKQLVDLFTSMDATDGGYITKVERV